MRALIVGANGETGRRLISHLAGAGHDPVAMVRDASQVAPLRELGSADAVVADLEGDLDGATGGCDAVLFAAGSGSKTGSDKTIRVDLMGAIRLIEACRRHGPRRFVMLSSMRADDPDGGPEGIRHYLAAKMEADDWLRASGLDWTIVRPGRLTDHDGSGRVEIAPRLETFGEIARDDVAAVMAACLDHDSTMSKSFDVLSGDAPISDALSGL